MKPGKIILVCALVVGGIEVYLGSPRSFLSGVLEEQQSIYDTDDDGTISVEEIQAMRAHQEARRAGYFAEWDTDGNGRISPAERNAAKERMRTLVRERRLMRFHAADNGHPTTGLGAGDGMLSLAEFSAINGVQAANTTNPTLASDIFNHLDRDKDGLTSPDEFLQGLDRTRTVDGVIPQQQVPKQHPRGNTGG